MTAFHPRFTRLIVSLAGGGSDSPLHQGGRNLTCTKFQLSKIDLLTSFLSSWFPSLSFFCMAHFWKTGRSSTSEKDTALTFPRNFAPLTLSRRPYGTLSLSVPSAAA